jgi:hypothetical protein
VLGGPGDMRGVPNLIADVVDDLMGVYDHKENDA